MIIKRLPTIIQRMKNIYSAYRVCKHLRRDGLLHACNGKDCDVFGKIAEDRVKLLDKVKSRGERARQVNEHVLMVDLYDGKYFKSDVCPETKRMYTYLIDDGVNLTDNLLIPFTPINLWKEIWVEHKIIFTVVYPAIALMAGSGVVGIVKVVRLLIAKV